MGKLNVTILRYLTKDDFRVLTAVNICYQLPIIKLSTFEGYIQNFGIFIF